MSIAGSSSSILIIVGTSIVCVPRERSIVSSIVRGSNARVMAFVAPTYVNAQAGWAAMWNIGRPPT